MTPAAHIVGLPVEETIGMFAPAGTVAVSAIGLAVRARWRWLRGARRANDAKLKARR